MDVLVAGYAFESQTTLQHRFPPLSRNTAAHTVCGCFYCKLVIADRCHLTGAVVNLEISDLLLIVLRCEGMK